MELFANISYYSSTPFRVLSVSVSGTNTKDGRTNRRRCFASWAGSFYPQQIWAFKKLCAFF